MVEPPPAPDDLSPAEQRAWRRGGAAMLRLLGGQALTLAGALDSGPEQDQADDEADETCPECGGPLVDAFGGRVCTDCDYQEETPDDDH